MHPNVHSESLVIDVLSTLSLDWLALEWVMHVKLGQRGLLNTTPAMVSRVSRNFTFAVDLVYTNQWLY